MKRFVTIIAISASFLLAGAISAAAQDEHRDREQREVGKEERHDAHQEEKHEAQSGALKSGTCPWSFAHEERHAELRRISDDHFRAHFGREHYFAVGHMTVVAGHPRFAYGGYRFEIGQPWPARWAYTDHCYIDFVEGRYFHV